MTPILETVFSLIFVFLVFSLITSWIVEYLATRFQKRAKMLRQFIIAALDDKFNKNWGLMLYGHPLIEVLHREVKLSKGFKGLFHNNKLNIKRRLPAYIPSEQFAVALIDLVIQHNRESKFIREASTGRYILEEENATGKNFSDFLDGINKMKESEVKITLASLARNINGKDSTALNQLTAVIAQWYDNGMERLNGWYKRNIRTWLFGVGSIVAVCFNVDTIKVVGRLYSDPQLRTAVSQAADRFLKEHEQLPSGSGVGDVRALSRKIDSLKSLLDPLNLPIGWKLPEDLVSKRDSAVERDSTGQVIIGPKKPANFFKTSWAKMRAIMKMLGDNTSPQAILGWLLTALALSCGAPFWFDALKKISNVRSVGLRPAPNSQNNNTDKK